MSAHRFNEKMFFIAFLSILLFSSIVLFAQQDPRILLFQKADEAMQEAKEVQANLYSPTFYQEGQKSYEQADEDYKKNKNLEAIRNKIKDAEASFLKAVETTKLAQIHFEDCINARNDALEAEAPRLRQDDWENAELAFNHTLRTLEEGSVEKAKARAGKAEQLYRAVELEAIKANYLDETKVLLKEKAKELKKDVPITLQRAQDLLAKAEKMLVENRYDTDEARQLAQEAKYEVQHAIYLFESIQKIEEIKKSYENILLESELPIKRIADQLDMNARFNQGADVPTLSIIEAVQKMQKETANLKQDLKDKEEQVIVLESQLGDLKSKEATLSMVMEQQKIAKDKYQKVEQSFTEEEAQVTRIGDQVVIRLYGLSFPVGQAIIKPEYFGLLGKVIKAIELYDDCGIAVEGHTDSWGGDKANQTLSTERAEAVREYLLSTASIDSARITAVGYGETKPIASNETTEGRRKNRRIEVVIHPKK